MKKFKIFFADLTHTGTGIIATESMPLNIGLLASYLYTKFGKDKLDIRLFKYPEKLIEAIKKEKLDMLGASMYTWNTNLACYICEMAKKLYPDLLIVHGGSNVPLDEENQYLYLEKRPFVDFCVVNEGELTMEYFLNKYFEKGRKVFEEILDGIIYLDRRTSNPKLVIGPYTKRIEDVNIIPSPYVTGLLDEFFDGKLAPMIETTRGCPFTCNYCNISASIFTKIKNFSEDYIKEELEYIAKRVKETGGGSSLIISDSNFGMYNHDEASAKKIAEIKQRQQWPQSVIVTTGKNRIDRILATVESLADVLLPTMSVQSMNDETLKEIKRSNIRLDVYIQLAKMAEKRGLMSYAELIIPLPKETIDTYWEGIQKILNAGAKKVISYTLQLNNGTEYTSSKYQQEHGYTPQWRLVPNNFGVYDGKAIFDPEMVATHSKYMSFDEYLQIRVCTLFTELMFNNYIFAEVIRFLEDHGFKTYDYLRTIVDKADEFASDKIKNIRKSFIDHTKNELFDSEESLLEFYSKPENLERLKKGEVGVNVIYKHKTWAIVEALEDLRQLAIQTARYLVSQSQDKDKENVDEKLDNIDRYLEAKLRNMFNLADVDDIINVKTEYDIKAWLKDEERKPLELFKRPTNYYFEYSKLQKTLKKQNLSIYGESMPAKIKMLARVTLLQNLFRVPHTNVDLNQDEESNLVTANISRKLQDMI